MKLAQVVPSLESQDGGPSRSVLGLAGGLAFNGHEVTVLTTAPGADGPAQAAPGVAVHRFSRGWPPGLRPSADLRAFLSQQSFDCIHAHGIWQRPLHYAAEAALRQSVPLVISPRGMMTAWAWRHNRWKKALARRIVHPGAFSAAAGWHATSAGEAEDIRRLGFEQPICVSPNGVVIPSAAEQEQARAFWQEQCPHLAGRVALFYSRFHAKKRILELIDLWAELRPRGWCLLAVGVPEGYSIAALQAQVDRAGIAGQVEIRDGTDTPPPYSVANLYILPTHSENFGLTVAEAMAHGLPVLTTDQTPWQGLDGYGAGFCVAWSGFKEALLRLLGEDEATLQTRGQNGRAWMARDFTWQRAAQTVAAFYRELRS